MNPIVGIPVHASVLTAAQQASLVQALDTLSNFPICLIAPSSLDVSNYLKLGSNLRVERFEDKFFQSFRMHQRLMISSGLYKRFSEYSHLLVYHLDAWVFRDELLEWCAQGYDYIGAPWRSGYDEEGNPVFKYAGNGGFSLRNIQSCIKTISLFDRRPYKSPRELWDELKFRSGISWWVHLFSIPLKTIGFRNTMRQYYENYPYTEDKFWAFSAALANAYFKVAPVEVATKFAFEAYPQYLYENIGRRLPFGCHAWRYEQGFWCNEVGLPEDKDFCPHDSEGRRTNYLSISENLSPVSSCNKGNNVY